jgi:hypothetical protein
MVRMLPPHKLKLTWAGLSKCDTNKGSGRYGHYAACGIVPGIVGVLTLEGKYDVVAE